MHPFVHRKDVPIKDYSRRFKHLQGGQRIFLKKFSRFCGAFYSFVNRATHSTPLVQQNMSTGCTLSRW